MLLIVLMSCAHRFIVCSWAAVLMAGCCCAPPRHRSASTLPTSQAYAKLLTAPVADGLLRATVDVPIGWRADPPKIAPNHRHKVWLSPTGDTAYGVINFDLPLPVGPDMALWGFLRQMERTQGDATLLSRQNDDSLPGIRFVAEGGPYTIRCNLMVNGFHGWVVYAGSLRSRPVNSTEMKLAESARDQTQVDAP